ncbi:hypothetical protein ACWGKU_33515 [Kitasatospora sp. NPDC054768]
MSEDSPGVTGADDAPLWDPATAADAVSALPDTFALEDAIDVVGTEVGVEFEGYVLGQRPEMLRFAEEVLQSLPAAEKVIHEVTVYLGANWQQILSSRNAEDEIWEVLGAAVLEAAYRLGRDPRLQRDLDTARRLIEDMFELVHDRYSDLGTVHDAMKPLTRGEFAAVMIKHVMGFTSKLASLILNVHPATVDRNLRRAKELLHDDLAPLRLFEDHQNRARGGRQ